MATVGVKGLTDGFTDGDVKLSVAFITVQYGIMHGYALQYHAGDIGILYHYHTVQHSSCIFDEFL